MSNIIKAKHERAVRIIKSKKLRKANNYFIEMAKIMKQLRVKQELLKKNVEFMKERESLRKWFKRTQVTIYMRKRSKKLTKEWHTKLLRTCFEAVRENNLNDKRFARKLTQVA